MPKNSPLCVPIGFVGRHPVSIGKLPVDVRVEVREGSARNLVKLARASLVRRASRLRRMVEKIVGEQFLEHLEIPAALYFLGVPPNNCLRGFAHADFGHDVPPATAIKPSPCNLWKFPKLRKYFYCRDVAHAAALRQDHIALPDVRAFHNRLTWREIVALCRL
jgi:hypothetical protein